MPRSSSFTSNRVAMSRLDPYNASWARLYLKQICRMRQHIWYIYLLSLLMQKKVERDRERERERHVTCSIRYCHPVLGLGLLFEFVMHATTNQVESKPNDYLQEIAYQRIRVHQYHWMVHVKFSDLSEMRLITTLLLLLVRKPRSWRHIRLCAHGEGPGCTLADKSPFKITWTELNAWNNFFKLCGLIQVLQLKICRGICWVLKTTKIDTVLQWLAHNVQESEQMSQPCMPACLCFVLKCRNSMIWYAPKSSHLVHVLEWNWIKLLAHRLSTAIWPKRSTCGKIDSPKWLLLSQAVNRHQFQRNSNLVPWLHLWTYLRIWSWKVNKKHSETFFKCLKHQQCQMSFHSKNFHLMTWQHGLWFLSHHHHHHHHHHYHYHHHRHYCSLRLKVKWAECPIVNTPGDSAIFLGTRPYQVSNLEEANTWPRRKVHPRVDLVQGDQ